MATKRGRMSEYDLQFIKDNAHHMDYVKIAKSINRTSKSVRKYMEEGLGLVISLEVDAAPVSLATVTYDIEDEDFWPVILQQFSETELIIFRYQWNSMYDQFGGDVLPTEKLQIIDIIKLEVLMNRNLIEQRSSSVGIAGYEADIIKMKADGVTDVMELGIIERQLAFLRTAQGSLGKDYREMQKNKDSLNKAIKGTRDQRFDRIEKSGKTILSLIADITTDNKLRKELGIRMEKMRLATIDEEIRLAAYHKYEDGNLDQPFLNCDTVKDDNGRINVWAETKKELEEK
jgi:hypothetical protein